MGLEYTLCSLQLIKPNLSHWQNGNFDPFAYELMDLGYACLKQV